MRATRIKLCQNKKNLNNLLIFVILLSAVVMTVLSSGSSNRGGNVYNFSADAQLMNQHEQKQLPSSLSMSPTAGPTPSIKITSHSSGQQVKVGPLTISGTSSDTPSSNCQVYADWNDNMPFGRAVAAGLGGPNDYSKWTFTYDGGYHLIQNGTNNLTSKISCVDGSMASTKWYSVDLIGLNDGPTINQAITADTPPTPSTPGLTEFPSPFSIPTQADLTPTSLDPVVGEDEDDEEDEENDDSDSDDNNEDDEEDNSEGNEDSDESGDEDSEDNQDEDGGEGDDGDDGDEGGPGIE